MHGNQRHELAELLFAAQEGSEIAMSSTGGAAGLVMVALFRSVRLLPAYHNVIFYCVEVQGH